MAAFIVYKDRQNKPTGAFSPVCLPHSPNKRAAESLNADGGMFVLHTWSLFIHQCKQEVKVAETSGFDTL